MHPTRRSTGRQDRRGCGTAVEQETAEGTLLGGYTGAIFEAVAHRRVAAVIAYCMTTPIGHEVVSRATVPGMPPPELIALNGSPCPTEFVTGNFLALWAKFAEPDVDIETFLRVSTSDLRDDPDRITAAHNATHFRCGRAA